MYYNIIQSLFVAITSYSAALASARYLHLLGMWAYMHSDSKINQPPKACSTKSKICIYEQSTIHIFPKKGVDAKSPTVHDAFIMQTQSVHAHL